MYCKTRVSKLVNAGGEKSRGNYTEDREGVIEWDQTGLTVYVELCRFQKLGSSEHVLPGPAPEYSAPCANLLWRPPPPIVYIVYWYICLTLNRVKVHKYFFRFEDYDGICGSTTRDTWNCQLLRLWRQRRRADARQTHMDYLWNKPRRWKMRLCPVVLPIWSSGESSLSRTQFRSFRLVSIRFPFYCVPVGSHITRANFQIYD
jgi:hypothetical protein